jgi:alpha-glucosidase
MLNNRIETKAIFSDCTSNFLSNTQPNCFETITIKIRTLKNNIKEVFIHLNNNKQQMKYLYSDKLFDYYYIKINLTDEKIIYYFELINNVESYYYDGFGCTKNVRPEYNFKITPGFKTPDWAKGAVMYQIFVDRFYNGDNTNDVLDNEYSYLGGYATKSKDWYKYPSDMGVREFYGGDLQGIIDKMEYLKDLGVEVLYLNPIFVSPSNHKYDIQDYDYVDPHIGKIVVDEGDVLENGDTNNSNATKYINRVTRKENLEASNELFALFVKTAHENGIKVIIDGVFNHSGSFNKWMDKERIYNKNLGYENGAFISENSKYNSFYKFYDNKWPYNNCYEGWWGHDTLPKLNYESSSELEDYIMNIGKKWISEPYNVDGWRLDVAADLGYSERYNHLFWKKFRKEIKGVNDDAIILAEHYGNPEGWLQGDEWDSVMNYDAFMEPITWFLTGMEKHSEESLRHLYGNADLFFNTMKHFMSKFQIPSLLVAMNQLSNHDHSRFLTRTNKIVGRTNTVGPEFADMDVDKAVFREAILIQMTWPGAPTLYYGDEAGLCGWTDPDNRRTYPWGREDEELIKFYKKAISIHKEYDCLKIGSFVELYKDYNVIAYGRFLKKQKIITAINNNDYDVEVEIDLLPLGPIKKNKLEQLLFTADNKIDTKRKSFYAKDMKLKIKLPAKSGIILKNSLS